jgi:hypothetical protein
MSSFLSAVKDSITNTITANQDLPASDSQCVETSVYYFELTVPQSNTDRAINTFLIPLVLNPNAMTMSEPFAMEATMTQGSGLYIERNGIIQRTLRIRGTTGWIRQPWKGDGGSLDAKSGLVRNWSRALDPTPPNLLSGQKHFQYLQDAVFRVYSQFSKDPATSAQTYLIFRNPRDQEAWIVEPRSFSLERSARNPMSYDYDIDLLVVDSATNISLTQPTDSGILDRLRDAIATVSNSADTVSACVNQLTAAAASLRRIVTGIDATILNVGNVFTAVGNFLTGATDLILSPYTIIGSLSLEIEDQINLIDDAVAAGRSIPATHRHALQLLADSLHMLGTNPQLFQSISSVVRANQAALKTYEDQQTLDAIAAAPTTILPVAPGQFDKLGTGLLPADVAQMAADKALIDPYINYTGSHRYQVKRGDTLASLAARYLGDPKRWIYIATANNLTPPFAQAQASSPIVGGDLGGALNNLVQGASISIPDFSTPISAAANPSVLGALPTDSHANQLLGIDFAIGAGQSDRGTTRREAAGAMFDLIVDYEKGGTDYATASGEANLAQAVLLRLGTEQGTDTLYPSVGIAPLIATGIASVDSQTAEYIVTAAITQDPRISAVTSLVAQTGQTPDSLLISGLLQTAASSDPVSVAVTIP